MKKTTLYVFSVLVIYMIGGCSAANTEKCIDPEKMNEAKLAELVSQELQKIYNDEEHFYRRSSDDPSDYELIE